MSYPEYYSGCTNAVVVDVGNLTTTDAAPEVTSVAARLIRNSTTISGSSIDLTGTGTHWIGEFPYSVVVTPDENIDVEVTVVASSKKTVFRQTRTVAYYTG